MAETNGKNGISKWLPLIWSLFAGLSGGIAALYSQKEQMITTLNARIEQVRAEESLYEAERNSNYVELSTFNQWQRDEQRALDDLRQSVALLDQTVRTQLKTR